MYKTKIIKISADSMMMMMQIDLMPETSVHETVTSTTSRVDDPYALVVEYSSYLLSISVVFSLQYILG